MLKILVVFFLSGSAVSGSPSAVCPVLREPGKGLLVHSFVNRSGMLRYYIQKNPDHKCLLLTHKKKIQHKAVH